MSNQPLSPQGYNLGRAPKNTNPFFDIFKRGVTATVSIGRVIVNTLTPGSDATASVENSGTATDGVFDFTFGIPAGKDGKDGEDGLNATIQNVNPAVAEVLPYGNDPFCFVQNIGTEQDANFKFTFGIPAGKDGKDGEDGEPGTDGVGVPAGGTTGQVLAKKSNTDYDTEWQTPSGGGGGGDTVSVDQVLTSGTEIGGVTVNGVRTALYAPQGGGGGSLPTTVNVFPAITATAGNGITLTANSAIVITEEIQSATAGYNAFLQHIDLSVWGNVAFGTSKSAGTTESFGSYSTSDLNIPYGEFVTIYDSTDKTELARLNFANGAITITWLKSLDGSSQKSFNFNNWIHNIKYVSQ